MVQAKNIIEYVQNEGFSASLFGDEDLEIERFCALKDLKPRAITWINNIKNFDRDLFSSLNYDLLIVMDLQGDIINFKHVNIIDCDNPKAVYFEILKEFFKESSEPYISNQSVIETNDIGSNVSIGHFCYIGKDTIIGNNVIIKNNVIIECPAMIGDNSIINSGVVIGTYGFGYYQTNDNEYHQVPHFAGVKIGNDVEIGANTCVDRGTMTDTIIGNGVKIDNLCHIAHNVIIGDNSLVIALSLLGGSCVLKSNTYIAPGSIIKNQLTIGENAFVGMGSVVINDVGDNSVVVGNPAKFLRENKK